MWRRRHEGARITAAVGVLGESVHALTDTDLRALTSTFRARLAAGESLDSLLPEALAAGREAGLRTLGQRAVDEQIAGAAALCRGRLVEMKTGEGKTLAIALAAYVWSLPGEGVHVITANEYLAARDAEWMRPFYEALGVSCALLCGIAWSPDGLRARRQAYQADVSYLTTSHIATDFMRTNMAAKPEDRFQRPLRRAIVDEADLVLIENARYVSSITKNLDADDSDGAVRFHQLYRNMAAMVALLDPAAHCAVDEPRRMVTLTDEGVALLEDRLGVADLYQDAEPEMQRALDDCLRARFGYLRDRDYVVLDGAVAALNQATGRIDLIVQLGEGLHQAIEIKEGFRPSARERILGQFSYRGVLRRYPHLAAATGTALEERLYREAYGLETERIATHAPVLRIDHAALLFASDATRAQAALERVAGLRAAGRPVLVVTASIAQCGEFSAALRERGIPHEALTANNHRQEAEIISRAGRVGAVTVVTMMAGRGVDIRLGGEDPAEHDTVVRAGGLYVLGFDVFANRRTELHMRGRAGRRGEPGDSAVLLSMQDPSTAGRFPSSGRGGRKIFGMLEREEPLDTRFLIGRLLEHSLNRTTQRLESYTLEQFRADEVRDDQAAEIYRLRDEFLDERSAHARFRECLESLPTAALADREPGRAGIEALHERLRAVYPIGLSVAQLADAGERELEALIRSDLESAYRGRAAQLSDSILRELEYRVGLSVVDKQWREHLVALEDVFAETTLHGLTGSAWEARYRQEAKHLFQAMLARIDHDAVGHVFNLEVEIGVDPSGPEPEAA